MFVPVVSSTQQPLMPTTPSRARRWIKSGDATPFWDRGIFCIRLNRPSSGMNKQDVVVGIDPGSKKEGITVKSAAHTFLNIQADAVTFIWDAMHGRQNSRIARRARKTPCRPIRCNRKRHGLPPSTKARWQWKLRLINWLSKIFPIEHVIVEDIKAWTGKGKRWDTTFSPLQVGKNWFYTEIRKNHKLTTMFGFKTKELRDQLGLIKSKEKMAEVFEAHCVDSWVLANSVVGGHSRPDNTRLYCVAPLKLHRRELHRRQPSRGGIRSPYGGTKSLGFKRGSIVQHPKHGVAYIGGTSGGRISLHRSLDGKRLCQNAKPSDIRFKAYSTWRTYLLPLPQGVQQ